MNRRAVLAFVLGGWAIGTLFMWVVATQNFAMVNMILGAPPAGLELMTSSLEPEDLRGVLRYEASELNRLYFDRWGLAQLPLAICAVWLAWTRGKGFRIATLLLALLVVGMQYYVVPETIRIGREIDFEQAVLSSPARDQFWRLHHTYTGVDMLKFLILVGCSLVLVRERSDN